MSGKNITVTIGVIGVVFALLCLASDSFYAGPQLGFVPAQMSNEAKKYGLTGVTYATRQTYTELSRQFCKSHAEKIFASICESPLCMWYRAKCDIYTQFDFSMICAYSAYLVGVVFAIGGIAFMSLGRLEHIGKGIPLNLLGALLIGGGTYYGLYTLKAGTSYLNSIALYPTPVPAIGCIFSYGSALFLVCSAMIGLCWRTQLKMIENARDDAWDEDDEDIDA